MDFGQGRSAARARTPLAVRENTHLTPKTAILLCVFSTLCENTALCSPLKLVTKSLAPLLTQRQGCVSKQELYSDNCTIDLRGV